MAKSNRKQRNKQPIQLDLFQWQQKLELDEILKKHVWFDKIKGL